MKSDIEVLFDLYKDLDRRLVDLDNFYFQKEKEIVKRLEDFDYILKEWATTMDKKLRREKKCCKK
jgi:hypothetical protein